MRWVGAIAHTIEQSLKRTPVWSKLALVKLCVLRQTLWRLSEDERSQHPGVHHFSFEILHSRSCLAFSGLSMFCRSLRL